MKLIRTKLHLSAASLLLLVADAVVAQSAPMPERAPPTAASLRSVAPSTASLSAAAIAAVVASPDRSDADHRNDARRKPAEMLGFIGVRPGMVVLDLSAGGGYTSELLARAVGPTGHVYGQSPPRRGEGAAAPRVAEGRADGNAAASAPANMSPPAMAASARVVRTSAMAVAERARRSGLVQLTAVVQPFEAPVPAALSPAGLDLATLMFNYHDLGYLGVDRAKMNAAVFAALKPGGVYVVADHAGRPGTGISESETLHRVEAAFVQREIEAAGFRLVQSGDFLRNPADPRDRNTPEPPMAKDEFVLRFVKP